MLLPFFKLLHHKNLTFCQFYDDLSTSFPQVIHRLSNDTLEMSRLIGW